MRAELLVALLLVSGASAQTVPVLHKRSSEPLSEPQTQAAAGYSALPADASGEYELDDKGSVIQITIQNGHLTGYITKIQGAVALSLFFDKTSIEGSQVGFSTRIVHGLHYSFRGEIVRGNVQSPDQNGFYRMVGELTEYRNDINERKLVHLKSTPRIQ